MRVDLFPSIHRVIFKKNSFLVRYGIGKSLNEVVWEKGTSSRFSPKNPPSLPFGCLARSLGSTNSKKWRIEFIPLRGYQRLEKEITAAGRKKNHKKKEKMGLGTFRSNTSKTSAA